jgi:hypothetical protein
MAEDRRIGIKLSDPAKKKLVSLYKYHHITQSDAIEALIMAATIETPALLKISQRDAKKNKEVLLKRLSSLSESDLARLLESRVEK